MVLAKVPTGLFGSLQLFLCPDGEAREECLDKYGVAGDSCYWVLRIGIGRICKQGYNGKRGGAG